MNDKFQFYRITRRLQNNSVEVIEEGTFDGLPNLWSL